MTETEKINTEDGFVPQKGGCVHILQTHNYGIAHLNFTFIYLKNVFADPLFKKIIKLYANYLLSIKKCKMVPCS